MPARAVELKPNCRISELVGNNSPREVDKRVTLPTLVRLAAGEQLDELLARDRTARIES